MSAAEAVLQISDTALNVFQTVALAYIAAKYAAPAIAARRSRKNGG